VPYSCLVRSFCTYIFHYSPSHKQHTHTHTVSRLDPLAFIRRSIRPLMTLLLFPFLSDKCNLFHCSCFNIYFRCNSCESSLLIPERTSSLQRVASTRVSRDSASASRRAAGHSYRLASRSFSPRILGSKAQVASEFNFYDVVNFISA
jgi:hypothetical protein